MLVWSVYSIRGRNSLLLLTEAMKNKKPKKALIITLTITAIVLLGALLTAFVFQDKLRLVLGDTLSASENSAKPQFVLDRTSVTGWWTTGNNWPDPKDADSNTPADAQWPIASMMIGQCVKGSQCQDLVEQCRQGKQCETLERDTTDTHCFVSTSYPEGTVDPDKAIADMIKKNAGWGITVEEVGTATLTMDTMDGSKQYVLHQFDYDTKGGDTIKRGNAQGYIPLNNGYIDVRAVCNETGQLDEALPVLRAVSIES